MKNFEKELEKIRGKTLLVCFPHPDDETLMSGGVLLKAKEYNINTVCVTLTKGGEGKMHIHPKGKSVKEVRSKEIKCAASKLRIDSLILENYPDAYLRDCVKMWRDKLKKQIDLINPAMIITYDHSGITGNPDHIVLSIELKNIITSMSKKVKPALYFATLNTVNKPFVTRYVNYEVFPYMTKATHTVSVNIIRKIAAARIYKSQNVMSLRVSLYYLIFMRKEWYHKVDLNKDYDLKYVAFDL